MRSRSFARRAAVVLAVPVLLAGMGGGGVAHAVGWGQPHLTPSADGPGPNRGSVGSQADADAQVMPLAEVALAEAPAEGVQPFPATAVPAPVAAPQVAAVAPAPEPPPPSLRPRFLAAVSMGASFDSSWSQSTKTFVSPTFAGTVEMGDGPMGFGLRLLSSQAIGRGADAGPDRLALDLLLAVRPWATSRHAAPALRWGERFRRALTLDVGVAAERISAAAASDLRGGLVFGAHTDLPLTAPGGDGELRVRLGVRRLLAGTAAVGTAQAGDSIEALGGVVVGF